MPDVYRIIRYTRTARGVIIPGYFLIFGRNLLEYKETNNILRIIGDVAQRVERLLRMQEAGGSNPPISTMNRISLFRFIPSIALLAHQSRLNIGLTLLV